jgi:predicted dehydrogenase
VSRLRFGVVGCGAISTLHQLPALRRAPGVDLVAVVDTDAAWAAAVARRFAARESHADYTALAGRVDAALIATPNHTHADIACALLAAGVHVLCEKPLATTRAEVDRMLEASARSGARLMAAHCLRFSPNLEMLQQIVADGWLGQVTAMSAGIGGPYAESARRTDFRRQKRFAGGGVLVDLGIHLTDLAVWLAGAAPLAVAYDATTAPDWEVETDVEVALDFPAGSRATLNASFTHPLDPSFTVRGDGGWASASLYRPTDLTLFSTRARVCRAAGVQHLRLPDVSMYDRQIAHFCDAVRSGAEFRVRPSEVRAVIDVIERCYGQREADAA